MKRLLLLALALMGCGSPSAPSVPTPAPITYPNMVGGWAGTWMQVYSANGQRANLTCSTVWIVGGQSADQFSGTIQWSGDGACSAAASLVGSVSPAGEVHLSPRGQSSGLCTFTTGEPDYHGFVSPAGGITVQQTYNTHCAGAQYGSGVDYNVVATFVVNRR